MERLCFRVALYARVSTPGQRERDLSVPEQLEQLRAFCNANAWPVVAEFVDAGISGGSVVARTEFVKLVRRATSKDPGFDAILTRDASRFGRGDEDPSIRARIRANGVRVDNIESPVGDLGSVPMNASQRLQERVKWAFDVNQREEIAPRTKASQRRKVRESGSTGSIGTGYGYRQNYEGEGRRAKRTPEPDPKAAPVVQEIFARALDGKSTYSTLQWLNGEGIPSPRNGARWQASTVRNILRNEGYTGTALYGRLKAVKNFETGKARYVKGTDEITRTENAWPAIIDRELFEKVQAKLDDPSRSKYRKLGGDQPHHILQGLGQCAACGWGLKAQQRRGKWYLICNTKSANGAQAPAACSGALPAAYVDEVVYHFVDRYVSYPGFEKGLRAAVEMHNEALKTPRVIPETALLDARVATLRRDIQNLLAQVERTGSAALTDRLVQRENELRETQERRTVLEASAKAAVPVDAEEVVTVAQGLKRARRSGDAVAFKECLRGLLDRVEVDFTKRANRELLFSFKREDPKPNGLELIPAIGAHYQTNAPLCFVARIDLRDPRTEDGDKLRRVGQVARLPNRLSVPT